MIGLLEFYKDPMKHRIDDNYSLQFYGCDQGIHIMVYQGVEPLTCKKERLKPLRDFLSQSQGVAFKGGLKLEMQSDSVIVIAKKTRLPAVPVSIFNKAIENVKSLPYYVSCSKA